MPQSAGAPGCLPPALKCSYENIARAMSVQRAVHSHARHARLNTKAAPQTGMHVPGPLTSSSRGLRRRRIAAAGASARSVVKLLVSHDCPTSRLRGMTSTTAAVGPPPSCGLRGA